MDNGNLRSLGDLPLEERRALQIKGGIKSGESKREKKTMKQIAEMLGNMAPTILLRRKVEEAFPDLDPKEITNKTVMLQSMFKAAITGDVRAFETFRDTAGEKPAQTFNINENAIDEVKLVDGKKSIVLK